MSSEHIKGGFTGPHPHANHKNILLIGSQYSDKTELRRELGIIPGMLCTSWYMDSTAGAIDFLKTSGNAIDVVFLDLSLLNADYPKEYFLQVKQAIPDLPVIVLTDRTDYDLQQFVMAGGAADNVSQWQLRSDPERLRNIIESSCARGRIAQGEKSTSAAALENAVAQGGTDVAEAKSESDVARKLSDDNHAVELRKARENSRGAESDMTHADELAATYATELKFAHAEMAMLRVELGRIEVDLTSAQLRGRRDLNSANIKSDAILKYAQDRGALDLSKAATENDELRRELDRAREWLSGAYTSGQDQDRHE